MCKVPAPPPMIHCYCFILNWSHIVGAEVFLCYSDLAFVLGRLSACKLQGDRFFSILAFPEMQVISTSYSVQTPESRQIFYSSSVQRIYILYQWRVDRISIFLPSYTTPSPTTKAAEICLISVQDSRNEYVSYSTLVVDGYLSTESRKGRFIVPSLVVGIIFLKSVESWVWGSYVSFHPVAVAFVSYQKRVQGEDISSLSLSGS